MEKFDIMGGMNLISPAFENGGMIPKKYTCDGENINPELHLVDVPDETKCLALIMEDPDSPDGVFTHWALWNIHPSTKVIEESSLPDRAIEAVNSFGHNKYGGPCPPLSKPHRYIFKLYALSDVLNFPENEELERMLPDIESHALAEAELMGLYGRE